MKQMNKVRDMKNAKRYIVVHSNDEVKIRRLALMYDEYIQTSENHPDKVRMDEVWFGKVPEYKWYVVMRMTCEERSTLMSNAGLKRGKNIRDWYFEEEVNK